MSTLTKNKKPNAFVRLTKHSEFTIGLVVIAKLLCRDPEILIFDEPTVGIDVGAKQEIFKLIERLTERGRGVILISSYLPEVMGLSDRLIVMAQGKITAEYDKEALKTLTEADVLRMASIED